MITKYYTLGELNDSFGTGLTLACYTQDDSGEWIGVMRTTDGSPFLGYKPTEVTEERYLELQAQIAKPDMVMYFPGKFPGVGVVDKATHTKIQKEEDKVLKKFNKEQTTAQNLRAQQEQDLCAKLGISQDELQVLARTLLNNNK